MDQQQARQVIQEINAYLQSKPWFDFEIMEYRGDTLVVMGSLDPSAAHDVEVQFGGISFISSPMEWRTDTSAPPLGLITGEDAVKLNRRFQVEQGHHLFRFSPEGFPEEFGCLVSARDVKFRIMKND